MTDTLMRLTTDQLTTFSIALFAVALLIAAGILVLRELQRSRSGHALGKAIERASASSAIDTGWQPARNKKRDADAAEAKSDAAQNASELPVHWLRSRLGQALVADEDKRLIEQAGFTSVRAQLAFLVTRVALAVIFLLLGYLAVAQGLLKYNAAIVMAFAAAIGFMLPKWVLKQLAAKRREKVVQELPLFVDLLRLLQGVGLSLDQSLQVMADDFEHVLKVLSGELKIANRQYSQGRSREHSLNRLATLYDNDSLAGLVALLIQVDRHGGAVQEPLHQFSERLRETRRSEMKARIGKITVKMTGVMVVTLLPALLIAVAGPGFLAVIRALGGIAK